MGFHPFCRVTSESSVEIVLGEHIALDTHQQVMTLLNRLLADPFPGLLDIVPAYATLSIFFDPFQIQRSLPAIFPAETVQHWAEGKMDELAALPDILPPSICVEIPTRYNGPDLPEVADRLEISEQELIGLHCGSEYTVFMVGFLPGFPYLGVLPKELQLPRRDTPRLRVPAGSVAIAGAQTGIYPQESPGGWHLIGQTDFRLFDVALQPPTRLTPGMRVKFVPL